MVESYLKKWGRDWSVLAVAKSFPICSRIYLEKKDIVATNPVTANYLIKEDGWYDLRFEQDSLDVLKLDVKYGEDNMQEVQLSPTQQYLEDKSAIEKAIQTLRKLGGNHLDTNPYKDAIIRLEGVIAGMRACEIAVDM